MIFFCASGTCSTPFVTSSYPVSYAPVTSAPRYYPATYPVVSSYPATYPVVSSYPTISAPATGTVLHTSPVTYSPVTYAPTTVTPVTYRPACSSGTCLPVTSAPVTYAMSSPVRTAAYYPAAVSFPAVYTSGSCATANPKSRHMLSMVVFSASTDP